MEFSNLKQSKEAFIQGTVRLELLPASNGSEPEKWGNPRDLDLLSTVNAQVHDSSVRRVNEDLLISTR